jgi:hypothetical protein
VRLCAAASWHASSSDATVKTTRVACIKIDIGG